MFLAFASAGFRIQASFRAQFWFKLFGGVLNVVARVSIWQAVLSHGAASTDISLQQMITYSILGATMFSTWDANQILREIGADIRSGDVVSQLMRPYSYPVSLFARQVGVRGHEMLTVGIPVFILMSAIYGVQPPASLGHAALFVIAIGLSLVLLFTISIAVSMIGFWVMDMLSLEWLLRGTLALFSGGLVPLWFYPDALVSSVLYLPFAWITFYPLAIYLGELDLAASALHLFYGAIWAVLLIAIVGLMWRAACRRMVVQGG